MLKIPEPKNKLSFIDDINMKYLQNKSANNLWNFINERHTKMRIKFTAKHVKCNCSSDQKRFVDTSYYYSNYNRLQGGRL